MSNGYVTRKLDSLLDGLRPTIEPQEEPQLSPVEALIRSDETLYAALEQRRAEKAEAARLAEEKRQGMELFEELAEITGESWASVRDRLTHNPETADDMVTHLDEPEEDPRILALESRANTMEGRGADDVAMQLRVQAQAIRMNAAADVTNAQALIDATGEHYGYEKPGEGEAGDE